MTTYPEDPRIEPVEDWQWWQSADIYNPDYPPNLQLGQLIGKSSQLKMKVEVLRSVIDSLEDKVNVVDEMGALIRQRRPDQFIGRNQSGRLIFKPKDQAQEASWILEQLKELSLPKGMVLGSDQYSNLAPKSISHVFTSFVSKGIEACLLLEKGEVNAQGGRAMGSENRRRLNVIQNPGNFAELQSDGTFKLKSGNYLVIGRVPAGCVKAHQLILRCSTNRQDYLGMEALGSYVESEEPPENVFSSSSWITDLLILNGGKDQFFKFELIHKIESSSWVFAESDLGFGVKSGINPIFSQLTIIKLQEV